MDTQLATFDFEGSQLRTVLRNGTSWFIAADACRVLDLKVGSDGSFGRHLQKLAAHDRQQIPTKEIGGFRGPFVTVVSESGLYKLVMRSDKPGALAFQDWVTRVVLPAIRKNGGYVHGQEKLKTGEMTKEEFMARAFRMLQPPMEDLDQGLTRAWGTGEGIVPNALYGAPTAPLDTAMATAPSA